MKISFSNINQHNKIQISIMNNIAYNVHAHEINAMLMNAIVAKRFIDTKQTNRVQIK